MLNDEGEEVEEEVVTPEAEAEEVEAEDTTDWKAKYEETQGRLKRAETKLSKAKEPETETKKSPSKSDDLDYGAKAYLTANGIKGAKEFDFVKTELKASGEDLDTLLENDYFKARLEKFRALGKTAEATPAGKRSSGVATDSVEYWMAKPFEEVPKDMRAKVVNAQLEKEKNKGVFYNS